jgi:hypothetical protein
MAYLNITNPTLQKHVFVFRGPGLKHNQYHDIHEGQTVTVYVGTENECHAILKQHQAYGLRKRADALSVRGNRVGGLLYSIDSQEARPIDVEDLAQIKQQDGELLDDLAAKERELYAIGAALRLAFGRKARDLTDGRKIFKPFKSRVRTNVHASKTVSLV